MKRCLTARSSPARSPFVALINAYFVPLSPRLTITYLPTAKQRHAHSCSRMEDDINSIPCNVVCLVLRWEPYKQMAKPGEPIRLRASRYMEV